MKKKTIYVALFATLGMMATGCQKENESDQYNQLTEGAAMYVVQYTVDGEYHRVSLASEEERDALMLRLMALAREGYEVFVCNGSRTLHERLTKDVVVYTTTSESDAVKWSKQMTDNGYSVQISFDTKTGIYTCTAIK